MKRISLLLLGTIIFIFQGIAQSGNEIVNIPDTAFLYALIDRGVDTNEDSLISFNEAEAVNDLWIMGRGIADMTGIEAFVMLDTFACTNNNIDTLNLSTLSELVYLAVGYNPIESLDLSNNPGLKQLWAEDCNLTSLDLSNNPLLEILNAPNNQLTSLDLSMNLNLWGFSCSSNSMDSLDVSANVNLEIMDCSENKLRSLDVSNNLKLNRLYCSFNSLTSLNLPDSSALNLLACFYNSLENIDVSGCPYLKDFYLFDNNITSLDLSNNLLLEILSCENNQLTELDVSNNPELYAIWCGDNQLTTLDLSQNSKIGSTPWQFDHLNVENMPTLGEICVWDSFPGDAVISYDGSPNVCFDSLLCDGVCTWVEGIDGFDDAGFKIYPNPATDILTIETAGFGPYSIRIYSMNGQEIYTETYTGSIHEIDLSSFRKGIYFLSIRSEDHTVSRKVVKL